MTPVAAFSPAAPYLGGKRNIARGPVERIGAIPYGGGNDLDNLHRGYRSEKTSGIFLQN